MAYEVKKKDSEIQQDVLHELKWDTRVEETEVGVEVSQGVVTLTGKVSSWAKKIAAQDAAHRVAGVLDVANEIEVKPPAAGPTDTEIAQAVRRALEWDVFVPEERIQSTVSGGVVTLDGNVDFWSQREDAEKAVRNLAGVRRVINNIQTRLPRVSQEISGAIEGALARHAEREAKQIKVSAYGSKVVLSGAVHSWKEKDAVIGAAKSAEGVTEIEDQIRVEP